MGSKGTYAGETDAKKIARATGYLCAFAGLAKAADSGIDRVHSGAAVGLCGPNAFDLGPMSSIGFSSNKILLIDTDTEAINYCARRFGLRATFVHGDISRLAGKGLMKFTTLLVLDLMGHVQGWASFTLSRWWLDSPPGSVAIVTFLAARESSKNRKYRNAKRISGNKYGRTKVANHAARLRCVNTCAPGSSLLAFITYQSSSPMAMAVIQKPWSDHREHTPHVFLSIEKEMTMRETALGIEADYPGEAHRLLCIPKQRVAAWKAHKTMGTYQDEKEDWMQQV